MSIHRFLRSVELLVVVLAVVSFEPCEMMSLGEFCDYFLREDDYPRIIKSRVCGTYDMHSGTFTDDPIPPPPSLTFDVAAGGTVNSNNPSPVFGANTASVSSGPILGANSGASVSASVTQIHNEPSLTPHNPASSSDPVYNVNANWQSSSGASSINVGLDHVPQISNTVSVGGSQTLFENDKIQLAVSGVHEQTHDRDFRRIGPGSSTGTISLSSVDKNDGVSASISGTHIPGEPGTGSVSISLPLGSSSSSIHDAQVSLTVKSDLAEGSKPKSSINLGVEGSF